MRRSSLYFAFRSDRHGAPVLIWPAPVATARSARKSSSVSPDRCEMTARYPALCAISTASSASESVPIWFTLIRTAFAVPSAMPQESHKQIIPDQLYSVPERFRYLFPAFEIVLAQPVFDGYDRVFFDQFLIVGNHFCGIPKYCLSALTGFPGKVVDVPALLVELACRRIDRDHHVVSGRIAGFLDRIDNELQCFIGIL